MNKLILTTILYCVFFTAFSQKVGYYTSKESFLRDSIVKDYQLQYMQGDVVAFKSGDKVIKLNSNDFFAFYTKQGEFYRSVKNEQAQKLVLSGVVNIYGEIHLKEIGGNGDYPEYHSPTTPKPILYFSIGKEGEIFLANTKNMKKLLENDPEILEVYLKNKIPAQAIVLYNKKHTK